MDKALAIVACFSLAAAPLADAVAAVAVHHATVRHAAKRRHRRAPRPAIRSVAWVHARDRLASAALRDPSGRPDGARTSRRLALEQEFGSGVTASVGLESTGAADPIDPHALSSAAASMHQPADGVIGAKVGFRFK